MANDVFAGPVSYVVFGFPESASIGEGLEAVLTQVDTGVVEILDIECITTNGSADAVATALPDYQGTTDFDLAVFDGAWSGLLDAEDVATIAESLEAGWFAIAVVYEDRSLASAGSAWTQSGGIDIRQLADTVE